MSLNDPRWGSQGGGDGDRGDGKRGDDNRGGNQGPPDLEEVWRDFNQRLWQPGGFHKGNAARNRIWNTNTGRANFLVPPSDGTYKFNLFFQFHHTGSTGQPNMVAEVVSNTNGGLRFRLYGGSSVNTEQLRLKLGPITKNVWYDFVYHIKWSSKSDGIFDAWINGKKVATFRGPTLYAGQGCYLKPSNYHSAMGQDNAVIHDRIVRGTTPEAVARTPLEGVVFGN